MVENKHGLGSILSFSAKSVNPKILEALLVGREKLVNQLEKKVKNIVKDGLNHQVLIVGARGTGKTHMLSVVHHRMQSDIKKGKIKVAYFAEEEYGVSGYLDFMVRILNAFIRWNEEDAEFLREQLSILQETPSSHQEETIKRIIFDYVGDKPLLILAENFNDILDSLKKEGQSKLRNWLQQNDRISIIATSQALSGDIGKEDKPFYGFFEEIDLKPLNLDESYLLLKKLAEIENKTDLIDHLETKGEAQVKAINTLVKGNHRLLITFYEFLKSDHLSNLSVLFIKTLNDLKPYYETFIRYQPPQQQKVIRFLALAKKPQKGAEIARECFIDKKSLSKQLSELSKKKLIEILPNPTDNRNKLYDIADPLLRISIEIGEQKEGISALFIDFLALYYDQNELEVQKTKFSKIFEECIDGSEKQKYFFEIDARERALKLQKDINNKNIDFKKIINLISKKEFKEVEKILGNISSNEALYFYLSAIINKENKKHKQNIVILKKGVKLYSNDDFLFGMLGSSYKQINRLEESILNLNKAIKINPNEKRFYIELGLIYDNQKKYQKAINNYEQAIRIDKNDDNMYRYLGINYDKLGNYDKAIENYKEAIKLNPKKELNYLMLSMLYLKIENYDKAKVEVKKAIHLNPNNENSYLHLGLIHYSLNEYENSIRAFNNFKKDNSNYDLRIENLLSNSYIKIGDYTKGVIALHNTISFYVSEPNIEVEVLSNCFINILKYDKNISVEKCIKLEKDIINNFQNPKELQIPLTLIQTFRKVVLENKEEALYELSKEQRDFFNEKIIAFRKTL